MVYTLENAKMSILLLCLQITVTGMEDAHDDSQENAPNLKCTKSMFTIITEQKATNLLKFQIFLNFACLSVVIQIQGHTQGVGGATMLFFLHSTQHSCRGSSSISTVVRPGSRCGKRCDRLNHYKQHHDVSRNMLFLVHPILQEQAQLTFFPCFYSYLPLVKPAQPGQSCNPWCKVGCKTLQGLPNPQLILQPCSNQVR